MIDESQYTDRHIHPSGTYPVEIVAYERHDGQWDVFVFEATGTCPELEHQRVDEKHIFVGTIVSVSDLDRVARQLDDQLGAQYGLAVYYREVGGRRIIDKLFTDLQRCNAQKMWVRSNGPDIWELVIRQKDFGRASEVVESNVNPRAV